MLNTGLPSADMPQRQLSEFEAILDVHFNNPELLRRALTHRSFINEIASDERGEADRDNERLEFLGDAILDFIVGDMLFRRFPDVTEGDLTQLRAALVRTDSLAMLATDCQLGDFLRIGKGEENSGGRTRVNLLCRGFEALIGAMYMDQGLAAVKAFAVPRLADLLDYVLAHNLHLDARSILQERSQAELHFTPTYHVLGVLGPAHDKAYLVEVYIGDVALARGTGANKRAAAQTAARAALELVEAGGWPQAVTEQDPDEYKQRRHQPLAPADDDDIDALGSIYDGAGPPTTTKHQAAQAVGDEKPKSANTHQATEAAQPANNETNKSLIRAVAEGRPLDIPTERKPANAAQAPQRKRRRRKSRTERRRLKQQHEANAPDDA